MENPQPRKPLTRRDFLKAAGLSLGSLAAATLDVARVDYNGQQLAPEQALTIQEALRAHTMGSAYAAHEEEVKGSIEPGKLADLVVWSQDSYTTPIKDLWQLPVDMTLVGGQVVFQQV